MMTLGRNAIIYSSIFLAISYENIRTLFFVTASFLLEDLLMIEIAAGGTSGSQAKISSRQFNFRDEGQMMIRGHSSR